MSDDFDEVFGRREAARPSFGERVARGEAFGGQTRHVEPAIAAELPSASSMGEYKPYGFLPTANIGETCDVQRWMDGTEIAEGIEFQYRFLMQVGYLGEEQIRLFLPDCIVVIEGSQLRDLRKKLARRQVTFIQQFNARVWIGKGPSDGARIDRIEIIRA